MKEGKVFTFSLEHYDTSSRSRIGLIFSNLGRLFGSAFQQMSMILCKWWLTNFGMSGRAFSLAIWVMCRHVCECVGVHDIVYVYVRERERGGCIHNTRTSNVLEPQLHVCTLMPTCMGERPAKGTLPVATSHRMTAKLYMSAALLSTSEGRCWRSRE